MFFVLILGTLLNFLTPFVDLLPFSQATLLKFKFSLSDSILVFERFRYSSKCDGAFETPNFTHFWFSFRRKEGKLIRLTEGKFSTTNPNVISNKALDPILRFMMTINNFGPFNDLNCYFSQVSYLAFLTNRLLGPNNYIIPFSGGLSGKSSLEPAISNDVKNSFWIPEKIVRMVVHDGEILYDWNNKKKYRYLKSPDGLDTNFLFEMDQSEHIVNKIQFGDVIPKPWWIGSMQGRKVLNRLVKRYWEKLKKENENKT